MGSHLTFGLVIGLATYNVTWGQTGWVMLNSGTTEQLHALHFVNEDTGYVSSSTQVRKTTDGGLNWVPISVPTPRINDIQFLDASTGYVLDNAFIHKTTDGGASWTSYVLAGTCGIRMHFVNLLIGFVGACSAGVYRTTNGGVSWQNAPIPFVAGRFEFGAIRFTTETTGFAVLNFENEPNPSNAMIYRTQSRGKEWSHVHASPGSLRSLSFPASDTGYAAGYNKVVRTTDGGGHWNVIAVNANVNDVYFTSTRVGYIAGWQGRILRTTDGGGSWELQTTPAMLDLHAIFFVNDSVRYAAGSGGIILKTRTGGTTAVLERDGIPHSVVLHQNYPNPFNPSTTIRFEVSRSGFVSLKVYNLLGQEVATLVDGIQDSGFKAVEFDGSNLPSGVYFYQLKAGHFVQTKKMLLIR